MTEVEYIKHMGLLTIGPSDVVVVRVDHLLSADAHAQLQNKFKGIFPNNKCVILEAGADIGVMREKVEAARPYPLE